MMDFFKNKLFSANKEGFLTDEDENQLEESTIVEAEKALEKLKQEETEARSKMIKEFRDIFSDLPILL